MMMISLSKRTIKIGAACLLVVLIAVLLVVFAFLHGLDPPPPKPEPTQIRTKVRLENQTSTILIPVSGSLQIFEDILNREVPWRLADINEPQKICLKTKSKLIPDISCRLVGKVDRGRIRLNGAGQYLTITIPVNTNIQAQNIGGIVKRETATGSMLVTMRAKLALSQDWQPSAKIDVDYKWGKKIGVNFLDQRIEFSSRVDPEIRKITAQIEKRLPQLIRKLKAREKAQAIWAKGFTSARAKSDPEIWVRFTPQQIGFAGYTVRNRRLVVNLAARAQTETIFGSRPTDPEASPLPNLMASLPPDGIRVQVPFHIPYSVFQKPVERALQLGGFQTVKMEDGKQVQARFDDVEIFAVDGGKIAIGIGLTIQEPIRWLGDVEGKIWIIAKPRLDLVNKIIGISNLSIISRTNSRLFNRLVGAVSKDEIDEELIGKISYDFSKDYDDGLRKADEWLKAEPLEGFVFKGRLISADLERLHILPNGLIVQARATGDGRTYYAPGEADSLVAKRRERRIARERRKSNAD
ncbi:hypothetical protein A8B75_12170 [Sphingomonadales bacterium EhC05]|nr:hypothetical protein A8B75_12170 [Sphingomonadales bacterium EhC05]